MPYPSLTARDTTADKIPSKCCGLGAFTGGAGFGLFVSVPIALVGKATRATKRRFMRKAEEKRVEEFIDSWGQNTNPTGEEHSPAPSSTADQIEREKEILRAQARRHQEIASLPTASEVVAKQSLAQKQKPKQAKWLGDIGALGVSK